MFEDLSEMYADGGNAFAGAGELDELQKALSAGSGPGQGSVGGRALVLEDLETALHIITFSEQQMKNTAFNKLKARSVQANGIMHEYIKVEDYGESGVFSPEITTGLQPVDTSLDRSYTQVRFLRQKRAVSHVLGFTKGGDRAESQQVTGATRFLCAQAERYIYNGDSAICPDEWDGMGKVCEAQGNVVNLAGGPLTKSVMDQVAGTISGDGAYGTPSDLYCPIPVQNGLDATLVGNQDRILLPIDQSNPVSNNGGDVRNAILAGQPAAGYRSSFGNIMFRPHNFTTLRRKPYTVKTLVGGNPVQQEAVTNIALAGLTPTTVVATVQTAAQAGAAGGFTGTGIGGSQTNGGVGQGYNGTYAGTYQYRVSACNSLGESLCSAAVAATVAAGGNVVLTWDTMATATYYNVYRSRAGAPASDVVLIKRVAAVAGQQTYVDANQEIAGCYNAYMADMDSPGEFAALGWAQLAPLSRYELPMGDTFRQWMHFLYGALIMYNPNKFYKIKNIGPNV